MVGVLSSASLPMMEAVEGEPCQYRAPPPGLTPSGAGWSQRLGSDTDCQCWHCKTHNEDWSSSICTVSALVVFCRILLTFRRDLRSHVQ